MSGIAKSIKVIGNFIAISYPLSSLLFLVWLLTTRKVMYWGGYNTLNVVIILLVLAGFLPFLISVFIANLHTGWRIVFLWKSKARPVRSVSCDNQWEAIPN